jgi:hypothetical protein
MSICNRCTMQAMQRTANQRQVTLILTVEPETSDLPGWVSARYEDEAKPRAFFMALTEECTC